MILIIGLGNPGKKYKKTRHNIGFMVIDELVNSEQVKTKTKRKKTNFAIWETSYNYKKIILIKPLTFINNSGKVVKSIVNNLKSSIQSLVVIHDDIDLPLGKIKISKNISSAGHKGVQSIIDELKTKNFIRVRIGIAPEVKEKPENTVKFVLEKFSKKEKKELKQIIKKAIEEIKNLC